MTARYQVTFRRAALLAVSLLVVAATLPLMAEERLWTVRGHGVLIDGGFSASGGDENRYVSDFGGGFEAALEYRASPRVGIELAHLIGGVATTMIRDDSHWEGTSNGLGFSSLLLGVNVHLTPDERVRVYVSPIVGHMWFSAVDYDWHYSGDRRLTVGNAFAWGGSAGMDIRIAESRWSISLEAKYIDTSIDTARRGSHGRIGARFDPFMVGVGFGFDF